MYRYFPPNINWDNRPVHSLKAAYVTVVDLQLKLALEWTAYYRFTRYPLRNSTFHLISDSLNVQSFHFHQIILNKCYKVSSSFFLARDKRRELIPSLDCFHLEHIHPALWFTCVRIASELPSWSTSVTYLPDIWLIILHSKLGEIAAVKSLLTNLSLHEKRWIQPAMRGLEDLSYSDEDFHFQILPQVNQILPENVTQPINGYDEN